MNDIGLTLAWLAVQVALVLGPALLLQALVARRGPAAGAWIAALSLGLVVLLSVSTFVPRTEHAGQASTVSHAQGEPAHRAGPSAPTTPGDGAVEPGAGRLRLDLSAFSRAWARFERGASAPAARCRPWASTLAALTLAAMGTGLLHLALGLWAIALCRRRGNPVDDLAMTGLLEKLRCAMECRPSVALVEVRDLATPAMAGWRRPVILLPAGWRSWDEDERQAVLAHELAHVVRGDYAAGLVARLALALNTFHPLVRWMTRRMQLQQELAADALGAQYAGGRARYLMALSRLALDQDGRAPSWPARAFLPQRGALIRRIAMLRDERGTGTCGRTLRIMSAAGLLGLTVAVGMLRGPAKAGEAVSSSDQPREASTAPLYLRDGMDGVVVFRPAATFRHAGMAALVPSLDELVGNEVASLVKTLKVDASRPGFVKLDCRDIEWVTTNVRFDHGKNAAKDEPFRIMFNSPAVRTVAPFDWLAFLRQWGCELEEVRIEKGVYFRINGPIKALIGGPTGNPCIYLPDDRTLLFDEESVIRTLVGVAPVTPAYLRGPDWAKASRGLLAVAIKDQDGTLAKRTDLSQPDDVVALSLLKDVDRWILSVDDADAIGLNAVATCRSGVASEALTRAIALLRTMGQDMLEHPDPDKSKVKDYDRASHMAKALLANLGVVCNGNTVQLHADGFGTLADYAAIIKAEVNDPSARHEDGEDDPAEDTRGDQ